MNEKINVQDLIELFAEKNKLNKKEADNFVKEFFQLIQEGLERDKYVKIKGLGTFKLIEMDSRESVDVNTGKRFEIQGYNKVSFTPESALKEVINRPFSHFEPVELNDNVDFEEMQGEENEESQDSDSQEIDIPIETEKVVENLSDRDFISSDAHDEPLEPVRKDLQEEHIKEKPVEWITQTQYDESNILEEDKVAPLPRKTVDQPLTDAKRCLGMKWFILLLVIILLLCGGVVVALYWKPSLPQDRIAEIQESNSIQISIRDTLVTELQDSITHIIKQDSVIISPKREERSRNKIVTKSLIPDSVGYIITGTESSYTIKEGETLTRVSLRFYGTKALWPYIVKHNPKVITNPNNVPYGTTIKIPQLKKKQ